MHDLAAHIHWWKQALPGIAIILGGLVLVWALGRLAVRSFVAERCHIIGYNSISNQFRDTKAQEVQLTSPEPPAYWPLKLKIYYRNGQLHALRQLEEHNRKNLERIQRQGMRRKNKKK